MDDLYVVSFSFDMNERQAPPPPPPLLLLLSTRRTLNQKQRTQKETEKQRKRTIITKLGMYLQCAYESSNKLLTIFHNTRYNTVAVQLVAANKPINGASKQLESSFKMKKKKEKTRKRNHKPQLLVFGWDREPPNIIQIAFKQFVQL